MIAASSSLRALAFALALLAPASAQESAEHPARGAAAVERTRIVSVSREETRDGPRWTVVCEDVPLDELLRTVAKKSGLAFEGAELVPIGAKTTVDLERRSLDQLLDFVLGAHGLDHELAGGTLRLTAPTSDAAELLRCAQAAWRVVEAEGDEHAAGHAKLAQGNLAEVRGELEEAYRLYAELAEEPPSPDTFEATYRAGRVLQRLGHWAEGAQHFRTLANLDEARAFHSRARLELARVSIELGDAKSALHLLNFLDANYETTDGAELADRRLVRARAFNATREYVEALRTLEEGEVVAASDAQARSLEIRAIALQGLGYHVEAARAWLIHAREAATVPDRTAAFEKAAMLSLEAGDELGTLFICREAAKGGADDGLGALAREARLRLGLDDADVPTTIQERLELAESLLQEEELQRAAPLFEGLFLARGALPENDQARVLAGWSRVVLDRTGIDAAIEVLSRARAGYEDARAIQQLDLAAAALFEAEGRFEEAAEAYRGNY